MTSAWRRWTRALRTWVTHVFGAGRRWKPRRGRGEALVFAAPEVPAPEVGPSLAPFEDGLRSLSAEARVTALAGLELTTARAPALAAASCAILVVADRRPVLDVVSRAEPALGPPPPRGARPTAALLWTIERTRGARSGHAAWRDLIEAAGHRPDHAVCCRSDKHVCDQEGRRGR